MSQMTPREIVQELDKHIVGQGAAKRAVAIALRNRWRRMQVPEALRALDNVVLTPHIGSATRATRGAMADLAFENLRAFFAGGKPPTPVPECR